MKYQIIFTLKAEKQLEKLEKTIANRIKDKILLLQNDPAPSGCVKLSAIDNTYRIRVSDYRVLYSIESDILTVYIVKIAHRKEAYWYVLFSAYIERVWAWSMDAFGRVARGNTA